MYEVNTKVSTGALATGGAVVVGLIALAMGAILVGTKTEQNHRLEARRLEAQLEAGREARRFKKD